MLENLSYPKIRLFVEMPLQAGAQTMLDKDQTHYLAHVLRAKLGDAVALFNGQDGEWYATLTDLGKKSATLTVQQKLREQTTTPDVTLCFSPLKQNRQDWLVEKAAELGVKRLQPVVMQRSVVRQANEERLRKITIEAAEQCERCEIPEVAPLCTLEQLVTKWNPAVPLIMADETGAGTPLPELLKTLPVGAAVGLLIGPEGGFSPTDLDILARAPYIKHIGLGPRILRAETAAIASLAVVLAQLGDWNTAPAFRGESA